jgi:ferric-chelate reductase
MSLPTFDQDLAAVDSGSPQPSTTAATPPPVNNLRLVFNGDIFLLALFACILVLSVPRAFARLTSGWRQGHILRSVSTGNKRSRKAPSSTDAYPGKGMDMKSDVSHTYYSHTNLVQHEKGRASSAFPHHVPTISSIFHPIAFLLRRRIVPGFSIGQASILALYSGILHYLSLYKSNVFTDPERTGFVAMSQIPVVFAFATKNNLLGTLIGLGYEKV